MKARDIREGFKLFYKVNQAQNGVGIALSQKLQDSVIEVTRILDCLMCLKINTGSVIIWMVSCYAPQTNEKDGEKEAFWLNLNDHVVIWPRRTPGNRQ